MTTKQKALSPHRPAGRVQSRTLVTGEHRSGRTEWIPYVFLVPFLLPFLLFLIMPLLYAFYTSVFQEQLVGGTVFAGADNYMEAFKDPAFRTGIGRMIVFGIVQIPV